MENMRGWFHRGGLHSVPTLASTVFFSFCQKSRPPILLSYMAHSPAHARSMAVTFPGNFAFQMVRSDAMQAAVFLAKLLGRGCVSAVPQ